MAFTRTEVLVSADQQVAIALSTDPAWHDALASSYVERMRAGDWRMFDEAALAQMATGSGLDIIDGAPCVEGEPVTDDGVLRLAARQAATAAMHLWQAEAVWPEGFEPGPVAHVLVQPLDPTLRAVVDARQGVVPAAADDLAVRRWLTIGDQARWSLQVKGIEEGGHVHDADEFLAGVTAANPRQGDALRREVMAHLRRMWQVPVTLGKGFALRSGSSSRPRGDAKRPRG